MAELISTFGVGMVVIVLLVAIPAIINFITWCKGLWAKREKFKNDNIQKGKDLEAKNEAREAHENAQEKRIKLLEDNLIEMRKANEAQNKQIALLRKSDRLAIKTWIKEQHEHWVKLGCIDNYTLDLLEERYSIYREEGGNSWAEKLMTELRALPVITIVAIPDNQQK